MADLDAVALCKLPTFWRTNPDLWFIHAEAQFQVHRVTSDNLRYSAVLIALDVESMQEVSDLIRAPPESGKYEAFKEAVQARFLHKLFTSVELGDKKPSQLLREMRSLAGNRVGDQVLRVRWQDLLPMQTRHVLLHLKKLTLDELAEIADELHTTGSAVCETTLTTTAAAHHTITAQLYALQRSIEKLTVIVRQNTTRLNDFAASRPSRSQSRRPRQ
ncbi:uncharacterized protein LOC126264958 [Aethina tumida]|uniref:uncharacterized protein LOC126264958 n=1 Tax=Aethina tumida TaxID=116153 RepID=UPI0021489D9B|nr:uncharacterized protein LOC126264958 [Aethina tumida]